jgi:DNA (cytosine-5)-methyltransferase 1
LRYVSLFSGVEAATLAWEPLGWEPVAFCEIDPFPSAVLAYRWPDVPNLGDITKVDWSPYRGAVDLVVGGSPCQSFSVAGGRESLDGESRLMFEYIRAVDEIHPRWILWENVPGVFSVKDGAFDQLITSLQDIGYVSLAWRVLDAQFFGVAQRRRRVFLVGRLGAGGVPQRYSLSPRACQGILRRASKRGKPLPPMLDAALRAQGV